MVEVGVLPRLIGQLESIFKGGSILAVEGVITFVEVVLTDSRTAADLMVYFDCEGEG